MRSIPLIAIVIAGVAIGCNGDGGAAEVDTGTDSDVDTDTDTDSGSNDDTDSDTGTGTDPDTDTETDSGLVAGALFVGNSYTEFNDLSGWVAEIALAAGVDPPLTTESVTQGGATLQDHLISTGALAEIESGDWGAVVLQGQSQEPLIQPEIFLAAAADLAQAVFDSGGVPVLFETWAREEGHPDYEDAWTGGSPAAMQEGLRAAYQLAADDSGGVYGPVGDAWEATLAAHPEIGLFAADGSHPSEAGTYLAACVLFCALTGEPLDGVDVWPESLIEDEALALHEMAEQAVFE